VHITIEDIMTKEIEEWKDALVNELGHFVEDCPKKSKPNDKKKKGRGKGKLSQPSRYGMTPQASKNPITRGATTSHHQSLHIHASWQEIKLM
jgi:hypothetical protein